MAHSYSYGKKAEAPYATAVFTSYDFTRQKQRAIKAQQRALTLHLKELKTRDEVMAKRLASRQVRAGQGCLDPHVSARKCANGTVLRGWRRAVRLQGLAYFIIIMKRIVSNIIVFGLMAVMGYTVYYTIRNSAISTITVEGYAQKESEEGLILGKGNEGSDTDTSAACVVPTTHSTPTTPSIPPHGVLNPESSFASRRWSSPRSTLSCRPSLAT